MYSKLLTFFLLPTMVLGDSFAHASCGAAHGRAQGNRVHIHISSGTTHTHDAQSHAHAHAHDCHSHSHSHSHPNHSPCSETSHDSDVIWVVVPDGEYPSSTSVTIKLDDPPVYAEKSTSSSIQNACVFVAYQPANHIHGPPLYRLHCAIRI